MRAPLALSSSPQRMANKRAQPDTPSRDQNLPKHAKESGVLRKAAGKAALSQAEQEFPGAVVFQEFKQRFWLFEDRQAAAHAIATAERPTFCERTDAPCIGFLDLDSKPLINLFEEICADSEYAQGLVLYRLLCAPMQAFLAVEKAFNALRTADKHALDAEVAAQRLLIDALPDTICGKVEVLELLTVGALEREHIAQAKSALATHQNIRRAQLEYNCPFLDSNEFRALVGTALKERIAATLRSKGLVVEVKDIFMRWCGRWLEKNGYRKESCHLGIPIIGFQSMEDQGRFWDTLKDCPIVAARDLSIESSSRVMRCTGCCKGAVDEDYAPALLCDTETGLLLDPTEESIYATFLCNVERVNQWVDVPKPTTTAATQAKHKSTAAKARAGPLVAGPTLTKVVEFLNTNLPLAGIELPAIRLAVDSVVLDPYTKGFFSGWLLKQTQGAECWFGGGVHSKPKTSLKIWIKPGSLRVKPHCHSKASQSHPGSFADWCQGGLSWSFRDNPSAAALALELCGGERVAPAQPGTTDVAPPLVTAFLALLQDPVETLEPPAQRRVFQVGELKTAALLQPLRAGTCYQPFATLGGVPEHCKIIEHNSPTQLQDQTLGMLLGNPEIERGTKIGFAKEGTQKSRVAAFNSVVTRQQQEVVQDVRELVLVHRQFVARQIIEYLTEFSNEHNLDRMPSLYLNHKRSTLSEHDWLVVCLESLSHLHKDSFYKAWTSAFSMVTLDEFRALCRSLGTSATFNMLDRHWDCMQVFIHVLQTADLRLVAEAYPDDGLLRLLLLTQPPSAERPWVLELNHYKSDKCDQYITRDLNTFEAFLFGDLALHRNISVATGSKTYAQTLVERVRRLNPLLRILLLTADDPMNTEERHAIQEGLDNHVTRYRVQLLVYNSVLNEAASITSKHFYAHYQAIESKHQTHLTAAQQSRRVRFPQSGRAVFYLSSCFQPLRERLPTDYEGIAEHVNRCCGGTTSLHEVLSAKRQVYDAQVGRLVLAEPVRVDCPSDIPLLSALQEEYEFANNPLASLVKTLQSRSSGQVYLLCTLPKETSAAVLEPTYLPEAATEDALLKKAVERLARYATARPLRQELRRFPEPWEAGIDELLEILAVNATSLRRLIVQVDSDQLRGRDQAIRRLIGQQKLAAAVVKSSQTQLAHSLQNYQRFLSGDAMPSAYGNRLQVDSVFGQLYLLLDLMPGGRAVLTSDTGLHFERGWALSEQDFAQFEQRYDTLLDHKALQFRCTISKKLPRPINNRLPSLIACLNSALCWHGPLFINLGEQKLKQERKVVLVKASQHHWSWTEEFLQLRALLVRQ